MMDCLICKINTAESDGICKWCSSEMENELEVLSGMSDTELRAELHALGIDPDKHIDHIKKVIDSVLFGATKNNKTDD